MKPRRMARWSAAGVALVAVLLVTLLATREPAATQVASSALAGHAAPEIAGRELSGATLRLSSLRGRFVLVNFFATWCTPCQREHPELVKFTQRHLAADDVRVLAVIFDDDAANVRRFFAAEGGDWPVVADPRGKVALEYGVRGPPESFLVDPDGFVLTRIVGEVDADGLDRLLAQAGAARS
ncbi:MAG TPA: TlpA disulfide reductase family protein [Acidimicrobiales bacterium]|nr:TlpA disulfide reductase family protein [Acidimicrobiales bacterium]